MRKHAQAPSIGSPEPHAASTAGRNRGLFGLVCLCVLGLATFLGSGASAVGADACPNAQFRQGIASHLPDCRAYEQVSPVEKNGADIGSLLSTGIGTPAGGGPTSPSGDSVAYQSFGAFAGVTWGGVAILNYLSRRTSTGWTTSALQPRPEKPAGSYLAWAFTRNLDISLLTSDSALTEEATNGISAYLRNTRTGAIELLLSEPAQDLGRPYVSDDLSHLVFTSLEVLTDEPGQPSGRFDRKVYEHIGGELRLVTREPGSNEPFPTPSYLGCSNTRFCDQPVSADGRHIFFSTPQLGSDRKIYRRTDGEVTELASPNRRTPPDPEAEKVFIRSVDSGNKVLFTSTQRLTDNANVATGISDGDLYLYDFDQDRLTNLSQDTPGNEDADVLGVVSGSPDGELVYFVATGEVIPGVGGPGEPKLFVWDGSQGAGGEVRFIGQLQQSDEHIWQWGPDKGAQVNSDGSRLVFESASDLDGSNPAGERQVYSFDVKAGIQGASPICISCPASIPASGPATLVKRQNDVPLGTGLPPTISSDGQQVVFSSPDPLVSRDSNGHMDAYLWSRGELALLSSGQGADDAYAHAISPNGDNVFFRTRDQLVPQDSDSLIDLYTAHVNGGFASQQGSAPPACSGDACQPQGGEPSAFAPPVSQSEQGRGNVRVAANCRRAGLQARRLGRRAKRLRRNAARVSGKRRPARVLRASRRLAKRAKQRSTAAKRCRARARRAAASRRAAR